MSQETSCLLGYYLFWFIQICVQLLLLLCSLAVSLGVRDFCLCDRFFNPTIKVVTFRLRGWCVLGVFLLPAFTRQGHEHQDLLSPCDEMHVSLLFKGCDLAATAGLRDTTAGLGNHGTLCTLPTFTQPSHELRLCVS